MSRCFFFHGANALALVKNDFSNYFISKLLFQIRKEINCENKTKCGFKAIRLKDLVTTYANYYYVIYQLVIKYILNVFLNNDSD